MQRLPVNRLGKKSIKYPTKRDQFGRSGRRRAFKAFDKEKRQSQVAREEDIKPKTAYHYYQVWKKQPRNCAMEYKAVRELKREGTEFSEDTI